MPAKSSLLPAEPALVLQALFAERTPAPPSWWPSLYSHQSVNVFPVFKALFLMWSEQREERMIHGFHILHSWHLFRLLPGCSPRAAPQTQSAVLQHSAFHSRAQHLPLLNFTGSPSSPSSHLSRSCSPAIKCLTTGTPAWCHIKS